MRLPDRSALPRSAALLCLAVAVALASASGPRSSRAQGLSAIDSIRYADSVAQAETLRVQDSIRVADSLAFDFHKWLSQPYDAGCVLVANGNALEDTFRFGTTYTAPIPGSLTDSPVVFGNRGPELSRALRGLPM